MTLSKLFQEADSYKEKIASMKPFSEGDVQRVDNYFKTIICGSGTENGGNDIAFEYMMGLAKVPYFCITEDILKKLNALVCQDSASEATANYRTNPVHSTNASYVLPSPDDVGRLMEHFINQFQSSKNLLHPIELAIMCHKRLLDIHPFVDGNDQTALLVMNLLLVNNGYCVVTIPPMLDDSYYKALNIAHFENDTDPLVKLITEWEVQSERQCCQLLNIT